MGVRLFTFFIYLHTPEGGGGTHFPNLNLTISPKKGSALLWPNVMDHDLAQSDHRTMHEALPPKWVDLVDSVEANVTQIQKKMRGKV